MTGGSFDGVSGKRGWIFSTPLGTPWFATKYFAPHVSSLDVGTVLEESVNDMRIEGTIAAIANAFGVLAFHGNEKSPRASPPGRRWTEDHIGVHRELWPRRSCQLRGVNAYHRYRTPIAPRCMPRFTRDIATDE